MAWTRPTLAWVIYRILMGMALGMAFSWVLPAWGVAALSCLFVIYLGYFGPWAITGTCVICGKRTSWAVPPLQQPASRWYYPPWYQYTEWVCPSDVRMWITMQIMAIDEKHKNL